MYLFDKFSFNTRRLMKFNSNNKGNNIIVYVAPSNFNLVLDNKLVPDKFHHLMNLLISNEMSPKYLLRYYVESRESLEFQQILRQDSILQVKLKFTKLLLIYFMHKKMKLHRGQFGSNKTKVSGILADFLNISLEDTLKQVKPRLIFSIGVTQDFLAITSKLGIKVIEVMHGVFFHHEIEREWGSNSKKKPDLVLTWHEHYSNILRRNGVNAITLGYPNPLFVNSGGNGRQPQKILVTLGYNEVDSWDPYGILDKKLFTQINKLEKGGSKIIYRIHPVVACDHKLYRKVVQWMNKELFDPEIHSPFEMSVLTSFHNVNFHLTKSSSAFFEASLLGIPTIFTEGIESLNLPDRLLESGILIQGGSLTHHDLLDLVRANYTTQTDLIEESVFLDILNHWTA